MYDIEVSQLRERVLVSEWYEDDPVVDEGRDGVGDGHFLAAAWGSGADEYTGVFSVEGALCPETAGCVPECLV